MIRLWLAAASLFCLALTGCSTAPGVKIVSMGSRAEAGLIVYTVLEAQWKSQLGDAESARIPGDRFLLLRLSITNGGPQEVSVPLTTLIGPGGDTHAELTDVSGVPDWLGTLRKLAPVETVFGWVAFDVPRSDYQLRVSNDAFDPADAKTALIEIPLRFESGPGILPPSNPRR